MTSLVRSLQRACRGSLRPVARVARSLLTPPEPPAPFVWHTVRAGPATGAEMMLPQGSDLARTICHGVYEPQAVAIIEAIVEANHRCLDIGGHYGYLTMVLAKTASRGQVDVFEPVREHADRIAKAAERTGCGNVSVHHAAVAGRTGTMSLRQAASADRDDSMGYLEEYGGVGTEAAAEHYPHFETVYVETVTLDSLLGTMSPPDFIKIDAEGAEAAILQAGLQLIDSARPRLLIELHGIVETLQSVELLLSVGYRAILVSDEKTTLPVLWAHREDEEVVERVRKRLGRNPIELFAGA